MQAVGQEDCPAVRLAVRLAALRAMRHRQVVESAYSASWEAGRSGTRGWSSTFPSGLQIQRHLSSCF